MSRLVQMRSENIRHNQTVPESYRNDRNSSTDLLRKISGKRTFLGEYPMMSELPVRPSVPGYFQILPERIFTGGDGWCSSKGGGGDQRAEDVLNPENKHECLFSGLGGWS